MKLTRFLFVFPLLPLAYLSFYFVTKNNIDGIINNQLQQEITQTKTNLMLVKDYHREDARSVYKNLQNNQKVIDIISKALKSSKEGRKVLRDKLHKLLTPMYAAMRLRGTLQFQFVFPNSVSFLRMHKPSKFGDDLSDIRYSFVYTNKKIKAIDGFEQGRLAHAFRYVFPLFGHDKDHIGAVEVSLSSDTVQNKLENVVKVHTHFLVDRDIFKNKTLKKKKDLILKYIPSIENSNYLISLISHVKNAKLIETQKNIITLVSDKIDANLKKKKDFSLFVEIDKKVKVLTFLSIEDTQKNRAVAYLVSYRDSDAILNTLNSWRRLQALAVLSLISIFFFVLYFQKQNEKKRKIKQQLYYSSKIINRSPVVAFRWRNLDDWPVEYVSTNVEKMFGHSANDFISSAVRYGDTIHRDDLSRVTEEVVRFGESIGEDESHKHLPYRIITKDGTIKHVEDLTFIVRDEGGAITHYEGLLVDITDTVRIKKEKEEMQKQLLISSKLASIGTLAAGIAHEINNPLAIINGYSEILSSSLKKLGIDDQSSFDAIKKQKDGVTRIKNIVNGLRVYARMDEYINEEFDINNIVLGSVDLIKNVFEKSDNIIIENILCSQELTIKGNPGKFQQIVMNLLSNAKDAMKNNDNNTITIETSEIDNYVCLTVRDQGDGIKEEHKDKIFDTFFTTKDVGKGTGMGLSIVASLVEELHGKIGIESKEGHGAKFTITIPKTERAKEKTVTEVEEVEFEELKGSVLVVDDEEDIREILKDFLVEFGLKVFEAENGIDALGKIKKNHFDVVITDIKIGYLDKIKVLVATGCIENNEALKDSNVGVITKPFKKDVIYNKIKSCLS